MAFLMAIRRVKKAKLSAVLVTLAVAFTVAAGFFVVSMITLWGRHTAERIAAPYLPYDAVGFFQDPSEAFSAVSSMGDLRDLLTVTTFPYAKGDSPIGPLLMLGIGNDMLKQSIVLNSEDHLTMHTLDLPECRGNTLEVWTDNGTKAMSFETFQNQEGFQIPKGWSVVGRGVLESVGCKTTGVAFTVVGDSSKAYKKVQDLAGYFPETTIYSGISGQYVVTQQIIRSTLLWHLVYTFGALTGVCAIACVLTVCFIGRKRHLGTLKVLGGTQNDLRKIVIVEAGLLGVLGLPLGFATGQILFKASFGQFLITPTAVAVPLLLGLGAMALGALFPIKLVRNATCQELLYNRPIRALSDF